MRKPIWILYEGKFQTIRMWAVEKHLSSSAILHRLRRGWDLDLIFNTPQNSSKYER